MTYWIRRAFEIACFVLFLALVLHLQPLVNLGVDAGVFARLSPLAAITASVAARRVISGFLWALGLAIATMLFGRFFCSWACPLGATIDFTDMLLRRLRRGMQARGRSGRRVKYYLLAALVLASVFGVQAAGWFDPLSIAPRSYAVVAVPYADHLVKKLAMYGGGIPGLGWLEWGLPRGWDALTFSAQPTWFAWHGVFLVIILLIVGLGLWHRRWWCRAICPLGALLGLLSQYSLFKRRVDSGLCTQCERCIRTCNMNAVEGEGEKTVAGECTLCLDCQHACPTDAIRFTGKIPSGQVEEVDLSRRGLLWAGAVSVASAPFLKLNAVRRMAKGQPDVIRPPGALEEAEFLARCTRCGQCLRVCRTNGLQPTFLESRLEGMWTPRLIPRIGPCDRDCTLCGHTCPSGAIQPLTLDKKHKIAIGKARFDQTRCIPWVGYHQFHSGLDELKDWNCAVCEEVCPVPTKAIRFNTFVAELHGERVEFRRPYVVEELCTGCGFCENVCPVLGRAAVRVEAQRGTASVVETPSLVGVFPERLGEWVMRGVPTVYAGPERLYEYIDGAGEPYMTFGFIQVAVATYAIGADRRVKAEVWEFRTSDDAFGAWSMDRAGEPVPVGWDGALLDDHLWSWVGRYYVRIEPEPWAKLGPESAFDMAKAIAERLEVTDEKRWPRVVAALPQENLDADTVRYFRHELAIQSILLARGLDWELMDLTGDVEGALGEYPGWEQRSARLVLLEYPASQRAHRVYDALVNWFSRYDSLPWTGEVRLWQGEDGGTCALARDGDRVVVLFSAVASDSAARLVQEALSRLQE